MGVLAAMANYRRRDDIAVRPLTGEDMSSLYATVRSSIDSLSPLFARADAASRRGVAQAWGVIERDHR